MQAADTHRNSAPRPAPMDGVADRSGELARRLRAFAGLVTLGLIWGLVVPLSGLATTLGAGPFMLTTWVSALSALLCLSIALLRGRPVVGSMGNIAFFLGWAVFGNVIPQTMLFWVAGTMPSSTISVIVILEGFIVYALAAMLRMEAPTFRRFVGLTLGLLGTLPVLTGFDGLPSVAPSFTFVAVLSVPLCYAVESLLIARYKPSGIDPVAGIGVMQAFGAAITFGIALFREPHGQLYPDIGHLAAIVVVLGICIAVANCLFQSLIVSSGSVFAGQCSYIIALAGIGWSVVLLNEQVSLWTTLSLVPIFLGVLLVRPKAVGRLIEPALGLPKLRVVGLEAPEDRCIVARPSPGVGHPPVPPAHRDRHAELSLAPNRRTAIGPIGLDDDRSAA